MKNSIKLFKRDLDWAVEADLLEVEQVDPLWNNLNQHYDAPLSGTVVCYYIGAAMILAGIGFFIDDAWQITKGFGLACILLGVVLFLGTIGSMLRNQAKFKIGGMLLTLIALFLIPVIVESVFHEPAVENIVATSLYFNIGRLVMPGLITMLASLLVWRTTKVAAFCLPAYLAIWLLAAQFTVAFSDALHIFEVLIPVSIVYGTFLILLGLFMDVKEKTNESFWPYVIGALALWGGVALIDGFYQWDNPIFCTTNVGFIIAAILLKRMIFLLLGGAGLTVYVCYVAYVNFGNSIIFPFILMLIGMTLMFLASFYKYHQAQIESFFYKILPQSFNEILPRA